MSFVDTTVQEIDTRLEEMQEEVSRLEAARVALVGRKPGRPPKNSNHASTETPAAPKRSRRSRRSGKDRATQALELIANQPGITIPDLAKAMKIQPNYLYRVVPKLVSEGAVRKEDQGLHPVAAE